MVVSFGLFVAIRMGAGPSPGTMNKEYQEATNEYLKVCLFLYLILYLCLGFLDGRALRVQFEGSGLMGERTEGEKSNVAELHGIDGYKMHIWSRTQLTQLLTGTKL